MYHYYHHCLLMMMMSSVLILGLRLPGVRRQLLLLLLRVEGGSVDLVPLLRASEDNQVDR